MNDYIAYCGLDCKGCEARLATVNNDATLRQKVAKEWSELNGVEITPEMINCVGCRIDGPRHLIANRSVRSASAPRNEALRPAEAALRWTAVRSLA